MFKKVLVPTDFSSYAHKMQECLADMPGIEEVVLLNIVDASNPMDLENKGWSYDSLIDEAQTRLAEQADHLSHLGEKGLLVRSLLRIIVEPMSGADGVDMKRLQPKPGLDLIEGGSVGEAIIKTAAEEKASLICMGAQGKGLVEGMLLGSVSTEVLRKGQTDMLIIRHKILEGGKDGEHERLCRDMFSKVMLTSDFSEAAEQAISAAKDLPGVREILLVHVIAKDDDFNEAAKRLNLLREELAGQGRKITVHVLEGHFAEEILALAKKQDVSLIMMGSQGKSWSRQIRIGSTTFDVARRSESPVMVIRPKKS
ncbi:MAG: universal stress protein [Methanothrix sp.]|jgi:nucleotide-binding universal stress UspA family protein|nr:universal stress protein [Methanothrix sp.]